MTEGNSSGGAAYGTGGRWAGTANVDEGGGTSGGSSPVSHPSKSKSARESKSGGISPSRSATSISGEDCSRSRSGVSSSREVAKRGGWRKMSVCGEAARRPPMESGGSSRGIGGPVCLRTVTFAGGGGSVGTADPGGNVGPRRVGAGGGAVERWLIVVDCSAPSAGALGFPRAMNPSSLRRTMILSKARPTTWAKATI